MPLDSWNEAADQVNIGGFYPTVDQTWTPRGEVQLSSSGIVTVQFQTLCCLLDVGWGVETTFHCQQETTCIVFTVRVLLPACECVIIAAIAEALLSTSIRCFLYLSVWETCGQIWWRWLHRCGAAYCIKTCVGKMKNEGRAWMWECWPSGSIPITSHLVSSHRKMGWLLYIFPQKTHFLSSYCFLFVILLKIIKHFKFIHSFLQRMHVFMYLFGRYYSSQIYLRYSAYIFAKRLINHWIYNDTDRLPEQFQIYL